MRITSTQIKRNQLNRSKERTKTTKERNLYPNTTQLPMYVFI